MDFLSVLTRSPPSPPTEVLFTPFWEEGSRRRMVLARGPDAEPRRGPSPRPAPAPASCAATGTELRRTLPVYFFSQLLEVVEGGR